jgi:hypothetical protein
MEEYRTPYEIAQDKINQVKKELVREKELTSAYSNVLAGVLYLNTLLEEKAKKVERQ